MVFKVDRVLSPWVGVLLNVGIAIAALTGVIAMQLYGQTGKSPLTTQAALTPQELDAAVKQETLRLQVLKTIPSLGFNNLISDWTFLQFLQYFGDDEARQQTGYDLSQDYFDVITRRDPRWVDIYPFLSTAVSFYEGKPEVTVQYMQRGTQALSPEISPKAWIVWRFKGFDQMLLLGDIPGTIRSLEKAAEWVEKTPDASLATNFRNMAQFLQQNPDSVPARFWAWSTVYTQSTDKFVRERAKQEILKLGGQIQQTETGELRFIAPKK